MKLHKGWPVLKAEAERVMRDFLFRIYKMNGMGFHGTDSTMMLDARMAELRDLSDPHTRDFWLRWLEGRPSGMGYGDEDAARHNPEYLLSLLRRADPVLDALHERRDRIKTKMEERKA